MATVRCEVCGTSTFEENAYGKVKMRKDQRQCYQHQQDATDLALLLDIGFGEALDLLKHPRWANEVYQDRKKNR